jgi:hypothetical protein
LKTDPLRTCLVLTFQGAGAFPEELKKTAGFEIEKGCHPDTGMGRFGSKVDINQVFLSCFVGFA